MKPATDYSFKFLASMRLRGDVAADSLISEVFADDVQKTAFRNLLDFINVNTDLQQVTNFYAVKEAFRSAKKLPSWADQKLMDQGAKFFAVHAGAIMNLLGLLSLPYCYAAADGARVLDLSERIKNKPEHRLNETADFVWDVMAPNAFKPDGKGFTSILKVRLLHAAIRFYTSKSSKWNAADWGLPVNQEDMAGTNLSFSLLVVRGLRKFGLAVAYADQQAFMHLWNVIGFLLGVDERLLPETGKEALLLEEAIRLRNFKSSAHGISLTKSLVRYFALVDPNFQPKQTMQLMRYLMGDEVAGLLTLPPEPAPVSTIKFLQLISNFQVLKQLNTKFSYQNQRSDYQKLRPASHKKPNLRYVLPQTLTS
ncbi:oxygenase MpaB family protein [Mucilaginibacter sp.]|uniref:oxygenase MpaB family protein n=1 Tax=Mucilaginibacter sp. TaxID=1882438 RepID=UPI003B0097E8